VNGNVVTNPADRAWLALVNVSPSTESPRSPQKSLTLGAWKNHAEKMMAMKAKIVARRGAIGIANA